MAKASGGDQGGRGSLGGGGFRASSTIKVNGMKFTPKQFSKAVKNTKMNNAALSKGTKRNQPVVAKSGKNVIVKPTKTKNVLKKRGN